MTVVNTNVGALTAQASMAKNNRDLESAVERLSSGLRINSAADDAAGMAIVGRMDAQITGLNQAIRNASDGQALIDTAEGAQQEVVNLLQRLRQLAVQSTNDTNSAVDRLYIEKEADQILNEINRISDQTRYNGMKLLDGTFDAVQFQVGHKRNEDIDLSLRSVAANDIGTNRVEGTATHLAGTADSIDSHNLTVAGHVGSKIIAVAANASAKTVAASVNSNTELTGVSATAKTMAQISKVHATGNVGFVIGNGTDSATITTTNISSVSDITALRDAINDKSGTTKITAEIVNNDKSRINLTHATGEDIIISGISAGILTVRSMDADRATTNAMSSATTTRAMVIGTRALSLTALLSDSTAAGADTNGTVTNIATTTHSGGKVVVKSDADDSTKTFVITGLDLDGNTINETLTAGAANAEITSTNQFATVSEVDFSEDTAGNISVGVAAQDHATAATFVGQVQFDSVRSFSVTSSAGTNASDNFTGGGTTADASTFLNVGAVDLATVANAEKAIAIIDGALSLVDLSRAEQGAISNRLDNTISNLTNVVLNTESSRSRINDADFAKESSKLTRSQILSQAATSMLAQANASKQTVLALLQQ